MRDLFRSCFLQQHSEEINCGEQKKNSNRLAAVLVPLVERPSGYTLLLTQRAEHLYHHAGQISFPGGISKARDNCLIDTALREVYEEIGLNRNMFEILGYLDQCQTSTGFLITPVVGILTPPFTLYLDVLEVKATFELPLKFIVNPNNIIKNVMTTQQKKYCEAFFYEHWFIWGATAAILIDLVKRIKSINFNIY